MRAGLRGRCRALLPGHPVSSGHLPGLRDRVAPRVTTRARRPVVCRLCWRCALGDLRSCGAQERPYLEGCCVRCALAARARELLGNLDEPLGREVLCDPTTLVVGTLPCPSVVRRSGSNSRKASRYAAMVCLLRRFFGLISRWVK